ncbi:interleukin-15-like [Agelaius tricolor]|uniref:interleukin-15-like n=1 Tax=Agelaius tricolor TaxID=9191 RepID=UPI0039F1E0E6
MCKVLIFGCVAAVILMSAAYGAPLTKIQKAARLEASIKKLTFPPPSLQNFLDFYTPNDRQECNYTTLACFLKELEVLKQDLEEDKQRPVINIKKNLEDFMVGQNQHVHASRSDPNFSNPTCKKCEANEKKKFAEFHQEMTRFLQSMQKEIA